MPMKVFPNNLIRSQTIITMNAAPQRNLFRSLAGWTSLVTDIGPVEVLTAVEPGTASLADTGVSFFVALTWSTAAAAPQGFLRLICALL